MNSNVYAGTKAQTLWRQLVFGFSLLLAVLAILTAAVGVLQPEAYANRELNSRLKRRSGLLDASALPVEVSFAFRNLELVAGALLAHKMARPKSAMVLLYFWESRVQPLR
jgi:hypothetical protein